MVFDNLYSLAPPADRDRSARLVRLIACRTSSRLGRMRRQLATPPMRRAVPDGATVVGETMTALEALPQPVRISWLHGPDPRGFLAEAELWTGVFRGAERLMATPGDRRSRTRLFDLVSCTEYFISLLPAGRIDPGFPARAGRFACRRLRQVVADLAAALLGLRLASPGGGRLDLRLEMREEVEQGRPAGRIDLGTLQGPAGPLAIIGPRRIGARCTAAARPRNALRIGARLRARTLFLRAAAPGEQVFPAAGSPLRFPGGSPATSKVHAGVRYRGRLSLVRRRLVHGTSILLSPTLRSGPRRITVGEDEPRLGMRVGRALRILRIVWPEAHSEVVTRTALVVPVREPGLVSYSLAARPGISFINLSGKRTLDLADDLLHETAHHLLHDLEEIVPLLRPGTQTNEVQTFVSPWRGTLRPLHGLLHGTFTFLHRAELLKRLLELRPGQRLLLRGLLSRDSRRFALRELRRELIMIDSALRSLRTAARAGLLTDQGRELVRSLRVWYSRLAAPGRSIRSKQGRRS